MKQGNNQLKKENANNVDNRIDQKNISKPGSKDLVF